MIQCIIVGIGGFIGAVCRYLIGLIPTESANAFPIKTLLINVIGSFIIGIIAALAARKTGLSPHLVLLIKTGFCGGFTTFSTFALESGDLIAAGKWKTAAVYMILSAALSIAAVFAAEFFVARSI